MIDTGDRTVRRYFDNVHAVNITELFFLCQSGTGHTGFFVIFIKEVLECDVRERLALSLDLHMFLCLDRLMQSVRITASRHDTSGKFIYDHDLIIFNHIILVTEHQIVRAQRQDDIVLDLKVFRIGKVFDLKEVLNLLYTLLGQVYDFVLFIDNEIAVFFHFHAHDGIHLGVFLLILATLHLTRKDITCFVESGGLAALS